MGSFFNKVFETRKQQNFIYKRIVEEKRIVPIFKTKDKEILGFEFHKSGLMNNNIDDINLSIYMSAVNELGINATIDNYCYCHVVYDGPKIFRPNRLNLEALENMKLNVPIEDYEQPFPTIIIEFPEDYSKKLVVPNPVHGEKLFYSAENKGNEHDPRFVIMHHVKELKVIYICIYFSSYQIYSVMLWKKKEDHDTIDDILAVIIKMDSFDNSLPVDPKEQEIAHKIMKVCLNCVLIMGEFGIKKLGSENPRHFERLVRHSRNKDSKKAQQATEMLKEIPVIYSFDQNIKLYQTEFDPNGPKKSRESGYHLRPFWRSGFYKMQHYGTGNSMRKRIRIPAVLVNAHLFGGENSDTTYIKEI